MVDIKFIKTTSCPTCGCSLIVSESVEKDSFTKEIREHTNGGHWEYREFACGYRVHYCPNFLTEEVLRKCDFDKGEAILRERRNKLKDFIKEEIKKGRCDDSYKERLLNAIKYI